MNFSYKAYLGNGRTEAGVIEAASKTDATRLLAAKGRSAFEIQPLSDVGSGHLGVGVLQTLFGHLRGSGNLSQARLFLDLAILTEADLTLPQALRASAAGEMNRAQRQVIDTIARSMSNGRTAAESFSLIDAFSPEAVALIASGERTAQIPAVMRSLATQMIDREHRVAELRAALAYPAFLLVLMCIALGVVTFVLVPSLAPIFENANRPAPTIIAVLGNVGNASSNIFVRLAGFALLLALASLIFSSVRKSAMPLAERVMLKLPFIGASFHKANSARYLNSLSLLIGGGTPMTEALGLAASCNPLQKLRTKLSSVRDRVAAGERLSVALERTRQFDPKIISLLAMGDEVNRLPLVLSRASVILDEESKATLARFLAILTPTITIILGLVIGGLVVSVMTALLSINDLAIQG